MGSLARAETPLWCISHGNGGCFAGVGPWPGNVDLAGTLVLVTLGLADGEDALGLSQCLKLGRVYVGGRLLQHFLLFKAIEKFGTQVIARPLTHLAGCAVLTRARSQVSLRHRRTLPVTETGRWCLGTSLLKVRVVNVRRGESMLVPVLQIVCLSQT